MFTNVFAPEFRRQQQNEDSFSNGPYPMAQIELPPLDEAPLVSVVVANYNYGRYLPHMAESVLAQTYKVFELIVCDDGSSDNSREILTELSTKHAQIRTIFKENGGQASAWNAAYADSRGDIICLLDADDLFVPEKLQQVVDAFRGDPKSGVVYHRYQAVDSNGATIDAPMPETLLSGDLASRAMTTGGADFKAATSQLSFRRELAETVFPLPERLGGYGDAYIQGTAQLQTRIVALPDALSRYRIHGENDSGAVRPQLKSIYSLIDAYEIAFREVREFAARNFGPDVSNQLSIDDMGPLWDQLGAAYILTGKPVEGVRGYTRDQIAERLSQSHRKHIWRVLFALPARASRKLLEIWWTRAWWKRYTRKITRRLKLSNDWTSGASANRSTA